MAERLTEYFENGAYTEKKNIIDVSDKVKFFDNGCVMGKAIDKLARVEDILEKYGIASVEELDVLLEGMKKIWQDTCDAKNDRDIWKRACELACAFLSNITQDNVCDYEDYFYQQAKKEKENKNDDTNQ